MLEEWDENKVNIIGQNGNNGLHYTINASMNGVGEQTQMDMLLNRFVYKQREACGVTKKEISKDYLVKPYHPIPKEQTPDGKATHEKGAKLDAGKNRLSLVLFSFARALQEVGKVGTYGATKYTDNGWIEVEKGVERYSDALLRHLLKEASGEETDEETNILHAAHSAWNALARLDLILRGKPSATSPTRTT